MNQSASILRVCAWAHVRRAYLALSQRLERELREVDLSPSQLMVLVCLADGVVRLSTVTRQLGVDRTTLYRTLRPLERRGLVETGPGPDGGRGRVASLTAQGRTRLDQGLAAWARFHHSTREAYGPARWPALISSLDWLRRGS